MSVKSRNYSNKIDLEWINFESTWLMIKFCVKQRLRRLPCGFTADNVDRIVLALAWNAVPVNKCLERWIKLEVQGKVCMAAHFSRLSLVANIPNKSWIFITQIRSLAIWISDSFDVLPWTLCPLFELQRIYSQTSHIPIDFASFLHKRFKCCRSRTSKFNANFHWHRMNNIPGQFHGMTEVTRDDWSAKFKKEVKIWRLTK